MGCVCKMNKQMNFGSFIFLEGLKLDKTKCRVKNKSIREGLKGFISYSLCKNGSGLIRHTKWSRKITKLALLFTK